MAFYLGIDIGGTNIACGVVDDDFDIISKCKVKTAMPRPYHEILADVIQCAKTTVEAANLTFDDIVWVGVGCPGSVLPESGIVSYAGNLSFVNVPLGDDLSRAFGKKVYLDNDANAAAVAEFVAGAAKGSNNAVILTLGTGLGSGIIIDKKLFTGMNNAGAEIGHMVINIDGEPCTCGRQGCFERYASASALVRMTQAEIDKNPTGLLAQKALEDGKITARTAFRVMEQGDEIAGQIVKNYVKYLSIGIINVINIFQPDVLCLGGGVCNEGDPLLIPLKEQVYQGIFTKNMSKNTDIVICKLANSAGIIGAAMLGRL